MDFAHFAALRAVEREGSFEAASRKIGLSPSAITQRINLLEERFGAPLVVRSNPAVPTAEGLIVCRMAEAMDQMTDKMVRENASSLRPPGAGSVRMRIIVNDDSVSDWFMDVLADDAGEADYRRYELLLADRRDSIQFLKEGTALLAVSGDGDPVKGCRCRYIGHHTYRAVASPAYLDRHMPDGPSPLNLIGAPCLQYSTADDLVGEWLIAAMDAPLKPPAYIVPSSYGLLVGALKGIGWGLCPERLARPHLESGDLVELVPDAALRKPLYWHVGRIVEPFVVPLTRRVIAAAQRQLDQVPRERPPLPKAG